MAWAAAIWLAIGSPSWKRKCKRGTISFIKLETAWLVLSLFRSEYLVRRYSVKELRDEEAVFSFAERRNYPERVRESKDYLGHTALPAGY